MPRGTAEGGAKAPAMAAVRKAQAKSSKRQSKGSALKGATKVVSEASVTSMSSGDRPNPRFACREPKPGSEDETMARSFHSVSGSSVGGHTPVPSERSVDSVHSLASDHVDHGSKTPERSESPADVAKGSPYAGGDERGKPPNNLSLAEGLERAQAAKVAAKEAKHSKKRMTSKSPFRDGKETRD
ncbi:hypothetical protein L917_01574 [Phytophthora nicotianae]|uniref:Uncharacterized protein n=1 Tax=Phytophthora nicotianae TaxID=4792 RepID=W2LWS9_PHYNI|nr:hypothetical protein L917_01574 [Phytophthora nicotianae]